MCEKNWNITCIRQDYYCTKCKYLSILCNLIWFIWLNKLWLLGVIRQLCINWLMHQLAHALLPISLAYHREGHFVVYSLSKGPLQAHLEEFVEWMGRWAVDINLWEHVKFYTIAGSKLLNFSFTAWFLETYKYISREFPWLHIRWYVYVTWCDKQYTHYNPPATVIIT